MAQRSVDGRRAAPWGGAVLALAVLATLARAADEPGGPAGLDFRAVVRRAKAQVFPAVVFIKSLRQSLEMGKKQSQEVAGSGVIISSDGEVLTNWHVVEKALEIRCLLYDGRACAASVRGQDKDLDLALVQLERAEGDPPLPCATLGDSSALSEGDFVMAMGAPWGLSRSVSIGIVSCVRRYLPQRSQYSLWLQTDASISPGNSGGPLVSTGGEVVGVNALAAIIGGDLGFAIPAEVIRQILPRLRDHGEARWSWTGLQLQPLRDFSRNVYFEGNEGVIVAGTDPDSPARRAGVRERDRLLRLEGQPLTALTEEDLPEVNRRLGMLPTGQPVRIDLVRDGEPVRIELVPREKGRVEGEELACPRWDLSVKAINQFDNPDLFFYRKTGVFIFGIRTPGNAMNAQLRPQDVILEIDGQTVNSLEDVSAIHARALAHADSRPRSAFSVLRNGLVRQVILDFARDFEKN